MIMNNQVNGWVALGLMASLMPAAGWAAGDEEPMKPIREVFEPRTAPSSVTHGKVAVVQWAPPGATQVGVSRERAEQLKQINREIMAQFTRDAAGKGAKMVIHSEFSVVGYPDIPELPSEDDNYRNRADIAPYVETVPGPSTQYFGQLAKELGVYIQVGLAERDPRTDQYFNSAVMLGPDGKVLGSHRKVNLFKQEGDFVTAGTQPTIFRTVFGLTAPLICADVYGSNPMQALAQRGVNVLTLSTSWAQMNTGMNYFKRGAQWVGAYLLAANQPYFPDSGVINPDGTTQSHIRQTDGIAYGYLPYVR